jgi:cytochrome c553
MRDIGAHYATLKVVPGVADDTAVAEGPNQGRMFYEIGQRIFEAGKAGHEAPSCKACHGPTGAGNPGPAWPALAGQHAGYTAAQLTAFRDGMVWGEGDNASLIMRDVASNLTDEEILALATYVEGLHAVADAPTAEALAAAAAAPAPAAPLPAPAADSADAPAPAADEATDGSTETDAQP